MYWLIISGLTGDGVGDVCQKDFDKDGTEDSDDVCPQNAHVSKPDFKKYQVVLLDNDSKEEGLPIWIVNNNVGT